MLRTEVTWGQKFFLKYFTMFHHSPHIVIEDGFCDATEEAECSFMAAYKRFNLFVLCELHVHESGVTQQHDKGMQLPLFAIWQTHLELPLVHLALLSRGGVS